MARTIGRWVSMLMIAAAIGGIPSNVKAQPEGGKGIAVSRSRPMMGTILTITVVAKDEETAEGHIEAGYGRIAELDRCLSAHRPNSELARVNGRAGHEPVSVSDDLFMIVRTGIEAHSRTRGTFDIAVAPLLDLWKRCAKENRLPTPEEIARARALTGADRIELDPAARTVGFPVEGMRLDLGGLGKGFVADEVVKLLKARGVRNAVVAMSGDIYALGRRPDGRPWRVGIQDPREPDSPEAILGVLELSDRAVSTAGNYQRYAVIQGRRYSHIVDPRTGMTCEDVPSVTVVGPDMLTTDIMDTALSVLGVREGLAELKEMPGVEAMFITFGAGNEPISVRSPGFSKYEARP